MVESFGRNKMEKCSIEPKQNAMKFLNCQRYPSLDTLKSKASSSPNSWKNFVHLAQNIKHATGTNDS